MNDRSSRYLLGKRISQGCKKWANLMSNFNTRIVSVYQSRDLEWPSEILALPVANCLSLPSGDHFEVSIIKMKLYRLLSLKAKKIGKKVSKTLGVFVEQETQEKAIQQMYLQKDGRSDFGHQQDNDGPGAFITCGALLCVLAFFGFVLWFESNDRLSPSSLEHMIVNNYLSEC